MPGLPQSITLNDFHFDLRFPLPKIWTQPGGRSFGIYWSDDIQHGVLHPEPSDAELSAYYDIPTYAEYLSGRGKRTEQPSLLHRAMVKLAYHSDRSERDVLQTIRRLAVDHPSVCDLGCGSGAFLDRMRSTGADVVGVDPSEVSEKAVRDRSIEFHRGTGEALPEAVKSRQFDVVTMFQSLEHCRNPQLALMNAASILRPGGVLCVDVPNMDCLGFRLYRQAWFHCDAGRHLQFFTPGSLRDACQRAGLNPIAAEFDGFTGQFTATWVRSMQECWDSLFANDTAGAPPRPSAVKSAAYLLAAVAAPRRLKYDVVRIYASKPSG